MNEFRLQIYTREKMAYDGPVVSIVVPGAMGHLGVQANHAPLVALLGAGRLWLRKKDNAEQTFHVSGGFLEVRDNAATLLVDRLENSAD